MRYQPVSGMIGPEHDAFAELLAGYLDEELTPEDRARVVLHLSDCLACRRALAAQTVIRTRLMRETGSAATAGLTAQILARVAQQQARDQVTQNTREPSTRRRQLATTWAGWLVAAALAGLWIWTGTTGKGGSSSGMMTMGPAKQVIVDSEPGAMSSAVISQFRTVDQSDLPGSLDLDQLMNEVPFHVPALRSPHMRLIASWETELYGEPVAAIAYRCHDRLVIQYVVSEKQFFRHPQVRRAIAEQGLYVASTGTVSTIAWPDLDSGSFLVGEFSASELAAMRL